MGGSWECADRAGAHLQGVDCRCGAGKVLRGNMAQIADGKKWIIPATIDDPSILDEIGEALKTIGYPK